MQRTLKARPRLEALEERIALATYQWDNGPIVTHPGGGFGGADVSALATGGNVFGYNVNNSAFRVADDFLLPATPIGWQLTYLIAPAYQTGSTTTPTINGMFVRLWDGTPGAGGNIVAALSGNMLAGNGFSNIYRALDTQLTNNQRPLMWNFADLTAWPELVYNQTYENGVLPGESLWWIEWGVTGTLASGPWAPPVQPDQINENARQLTVSSNTWGPITDTGGNQGAQDLHFIIEAEEVSAGDSFAKLIQKTDLNMPVQDSTGVVNDGMSMNPFDLGNVSTLPQQEAISAPISQPIQEAPPVNNDLTVLRTDDLFQVL